MNWFTRKPPAVDGVAAIEAIETTPQLGDGKKKRLIGGRAFGLVGLVGLAIVGMFLMLQVDNIKRATAAPERRDVVESPKLKLSEIPPAAEKVEATPAAAPPPQQQTAGAAWSTVSPRMAPAASTPPPPPSEPDSISSSTGYRGPPAVVEVSAQAESKPDAWDQRLRSSRPPMEYASLIPNPELTLGADTRIACRLDSYVQSDQPGPITCHTIEDVWSLTQTVILMERETKVAGRQTDPLTQGKTNVFAVWDYARTPNHVYVSMHSPVVGPLGQAGMSGYVDTHFKERFGGTIMLSLISDFGQAAANSQNRSDGVSFSNTSRGAQDAASLALENSINIAPTFHKLPGEIVYVQLRGARDFSDVYDLVAR